MQNCSTWKVVHLVLRLASVAWCRLALRSRHQITSSCRSCIMPARTSQARGLRHGDFCALHAAFVVFKVLEVLFKHLVIQDGVLVQLAIQPREARGDGCPNPQHDRDGREVEAQLGDVEEALHRSPPLESIEKVYIKYTLCLPSLEIVSEGRVDDLVFGQALESWLP